MRFIQQGATGQDSCHGIFIVCSLRKPVFSPHVELGQRLWVLHVGLYPDVRHFERSRQGRQEAEERRVLRTDSWAIQGTSQQV